jgi:hypothetical protein
MKGFILFSVMNFCLIGGAMSQNSNKKQNLPQEKSKVTREYDEKGNLIKFDSVYSYSYSSDSTLLKNFTPKDFFENKFYFPNDSTVNGKFNFDGFDPMFAFPFGNLDSKQDSIWMKNFAQGRHLHSFDLNDSTLLSSKDFDELFNHFFESKNDSTYSKNQGKTTEKYQPQSMDEMMKFLRKQMEEMEKQQQQFFKNNGKSEEY